MIRDLLIACTFIIVSSVVFEKTAAGSNDSSNGHSRHDELRKAKRVEKEIVRLENALSEFHAMTAEANTLDMPAERQRYRKLHTQLVSAMQRAAARANAHAIVVGREHMTIRYTAAAVKPVTGESATPVARSTGDQPNLVSPSDPDRPVPGLPDYRNTGIVPVDAAGRVERMRVLIAESKALAHLAGRGDVEAIKKNGAIVREFHTLMQADLSASRQYVERIGSADNPVQEPNRPPDHKAKNGTKKKKHHQADHGDD